MMPVISKRFRNKTHLIYYKFYTNIQTRITTKPYQLRIPDQLILYYTRRVNVICISDTSTNHPLNCITYGYLLVNSIGVGQVENTMKTECHSRDKSFWRHVYIKIL